MALQPTKEEEGEDLYAVLGLKVDATETEIRKAFLSLSLRWHPDKNGGSQEANDKFMRIKEAKLFLMDGKKREMYDKKRAERKKMENLMAERNRHMGQRRRQAREEVERRERNVTGGASSGLGPGGEARVAAVKLEDLRKQGDALRQQHSVAWDTARATSKKRRASWGASVSGADNDDAELERTIKVKWSTKKQSHSDHTLDVLFSRFGKVESVSIQEGRGDRAFVTFAALSSAAGAVEEYRDGETLRANFVGKRRTNRSGIFAPRRQTMSPTAHRSGATNGAGGGDIAQSSFRDRESLVMMKLRQEAERKALIRKMAEQEGSSMATTRGKATQQSGDVAANEQAGGIEPIFPVPLQAKALNLAPPVCSSIGSTGGSRSAPTTPASGREAKGVGTGSIDEGGILARMFATKR